jgi:hypothetical protein
VQEPTKERTEHEPGLRCKGDIGGQTDDDAEHQAQHGSKPDGGSDADAVIDDLPNENGSTKRLGRCFLPEVSPARALT